MIRVGLHGAAGKMGLQVAAQVIHDPELTLVAATEHPDHPDQGADLGTLARTWAVDVPVGLLSEVAFAGCDVVVDFSSPAGTRQLLDIVGSPALLVGTTNLSSALRAALRGYAEARGPVILSNNFSIGVNVLIGLVERAAGMLHDYDLEIVEMHHRHKRDAPSGTARSLAAAAARGRALIAEDRLVHGRVGEVGPRTQGEFGIHAVRGGDVAGEHTVILAGPGERLQLNHLATTRAAFVGGVLRAIHWIARREPGWYHMTDVLGLSDR